MTRKSFTVPSWPITTGREVFRARGLCAGPKPQALGKPVGQKWARRRVPDPRMKADGAGDRCPDPPMGGSRRAWGSRRCRLAGRVRDLTVPFAQTVGALAPRPRRTGAGDSRAGCQRIRECRDAGAGREGARSHCEVGVQAARQQATRLRRRGTGRGRACRHTRAAHHFKRAFRGRMTRADRRCTTPGRLAREAKGPCTCHPGRNTPGDACRSSPSGRRGNRSLGPSWLITAGSSRSRTGSPRMSARSAWACFKDRGDSDQYQDDASPERKKPRWFL